MPDTPPRALLVHISARSVVISVAILMLLWVALRIPAILTIVAVALILAAAMLPGVTYFHKKLRWPRVASILAVYGLIIGTATLLGLIVVPTVIDQSETLVTNLPVYTEKVRDTYSWLKGLDARFHMLPDLNKLASTVSGYAAGWLKSTLGIAGQVLGAFATVFLILIITFFLLLDGPDLKRGLMSLIPPKHRELWGAQFEPIAMKLGAYVQGVGISIGFLTTYLAIALSVAGVPLALALAIVAGCMEIIPLVGSLLGAIPAVLIALTVSWKLALVVVGIFAVGNVIQGNVVAPFVFSRSIEVSPVMIMLALLVGGQLMGIAGAIIAVPLMAAIQVLVQNLYVEPMERAAAAAAPADGPDMPLLAEAPPSLPPP